MAIRWQAIWLFAGGAVVGVLLTWAWPREPSEHQDPTLNVEPHADEPSKARLHGSTEEALRRDYLACERGKNALSDELAALRETVRKLTAEIDAVELDPSRFTPSEKVDRWRERELGLLVVKLPEDRTVEEAAGDLGSAAPMFRHYVKTLPDADVGRFLDVNWQGRLETLRKQGVELTSAEAAALREVFWEEWLGFRAWVQRDYREMLIDVRTRGDVDRASTANLVRLSTLTASLQRRFQVLLRDKLPDDRVREAIRVLL